MNNSEQFESFLPVYDVVPEKWDDARPFLVENFKRISNIVNVREIGYYLDEELLTGQNFIPSPPPADQQVFRAVFRKVVNCSPIIAAVPNTFPHGITFDANFTLVHMYGAATNSGTLVAQPFPNGADTLSMDALDVIINSAAAYDRCYVVIEYLQEV